MAYEPLEIMGFQMPIEQMNKEQLKDYAKWFDSVLPARIKILTAEIQSTPNYEKWKADFSPTSLDSMGLWFYDRIKNLPLLDKNLEEILHGLENWFFTNVIPEIHHITPEALFADFKSWWIDELGNNLDIKRGADLAMQWFYERIAPKDAEEHSEDILAFENQWLTITHGQIIDPICFSIFADVGMYLSTVFAYYIKENYPHIKWHKSFGTRKYRHYYSHLHVLETNELMVDFNPISAVTDMGFGICEGSKNSTALKDLFNLWTDSITLYNKQMPILAELADAGIKVKSLWDFRYEQNPNKRKIFSQAFSILCKHIKEEKDPYILEAIVCGLLREELKNERAPSIALEVLENSSSTLPLSVRRFLVQLAMQDKSLKDKANKYL